MGLNEDLVSLFHESPGGFISGEELAGKLGVSRTTIWNHIRLLKKTGYRFTAHTHAGYKLVGVPDKLRPEEIAFRLTSRFIGRTIHYYEEVTSTNDVALELAAGGEPEGTAVVAESQTKGRGRFGRNWFSPPGRNLVVSLILRPSFAPGRVSQLGITTAVSAAACLRDLFDLPALIKWPNDVYIRGKKAGGILTELSAEMDCIHYAVIGIGLNLNLEKKEIPQGLRSNCTSVRIQTGTKCDRVAVAVRLFQVLEKRYRRLLQEGFSPIIDEWMDLSLTLGKRIEAFSEGGKLTGYPTGLDEDGGLLIRLESGITKKISVGDITVMSLGGKE